jgi:peptidoglycan/xylan/chitin deacetylase (PgdA/CDA1 family)
MLHFLQSLFRHSGFVLAFHVIPSEQLVAFVENLSPLQPIPLDELVRRVRQRKSTSGVFAITVDDGVGENVRAITSALAGRGWPATFYLPTHYIDTGQPMAFQWWAEIEQLLPSRTVHLPSGAFDLSCAAGRQALWDNMQSLWHTQRPESYCLTINELIDAALREHGISRESLNPPTPITWAEVSQLSCNGLFQFESHGVSHAAMSSLTAEEIKREMRQSKETIAQHTGRVCRHLAYPFGNPLSIGEIAPVLAQQVYDSAVTMTLGQADGAHPWLLPRIPLYPENSKLFAQCKILLTCYGRRRSFSLGGA